MNYLAASVSNRGLIKRFGVTALAVILLAGFYFVMLPAQARAAACTVPSTDFGTATATIKVDTAGTYQVWSRMQAPDATNNSFLLEVDGTTCFTVGDSAIAANTWTWVDYQNGTATSKNRMTLNAGNHTIKMIGREAGVKVGRILMVSDLNCVPTDNGDNCAVAGDTTAPTIDVTAPAAGASVANTVNIAASATDNVGVTKVEFYVNGVLKSTDTASPYAYAWDSKSVVNGAASLMAKAYDAAGNINSDTVQVQVLNGDTQAPSTPSNVAAQANAYNKVTVSWTASTDNVGVTGYRIIRNGASIAQINAVSQYVDTTVLPDTAYNYQVIAYDAAGNASTASTSVQVKTPNQPDTQAPSAPGSLTAVAVGTSQINLSWTASTDNVGVAVYDVYRAVGSGTAAKVGTVSTLSYGDTGLSASTNYSYYVVARDTAGNASAQSNTATAQTAAKPPKKGRGNVKGKVTYTANSYQHAHVSIRINGVKHTYDTTKSGSFLITDVPTGSYRLKFDAEGSYNKEVTVNIEADKTKTQNVTLRAR